MRKILYLFLFCFLFQACMKSKPRILVFSKTKGYRHASINVGKPAIQKLGLENEFDVDTTELATYFTDDSLKRYSAVVFLSTTGDVLDEQQQNAFKRFIHAGGGFVGVHAAADTEYDWWWYGKLVGAYFKSHPKTQKARVLKQPTTVMDRTVPEPWERTDEWYNYRNIAPDLNILYKLDETSYEGGDNAGDHPLVWYHTFDGGRAFYTGMGHTDESYTDPDYMAQLLMGIQYAIGDNDVSYSKVKEEVRPEDNRFTKKVLGFYLNEPTEMTILPDGRILFLERKGAIKLFDPATDSIKTVNQFNVNTTFEDGMIGLTKDPDFEKNNWLYIFYSHPQRSANVLSRFTFKDGAVDMNSEKELLEVVTQRDKCCHTGGSLTFGPGKNLFISTGDNTSPFESNGFSPSDEQPGRSPFDAQKSSANTNDLRGKILRIHPEDDGTYSIPEGNLFPKGEALTRSEIYVMGCRNPYRINVDSKTGFLYWGDVGPDAGNDSEERGPRGYDEVNQARKAGYFGWPYFVGGNFPYAEYDFANKVAGPRHDPLKPINNSPNNTGKQELPAVSPPFIWYPYAITNEFPLMKQGSRNAMAGPVYYSEKYKGQSESFPSYMDGKLIFFDWTRNWVRLATLNEAGDIMDIETFLDPIHFNNISDMEFGPDGKLYTLEYGTKWFSINEDARLSVIEYNKGNRLPVPAFSSNVKNGAIPLVVKFSANGTSDPDDDALTYSLLVNEETLQSTDGNFEYTFTQPGIFRPRLVVKDDKGAESQSELMIIAGNATPVVNINWTGNTQFYLTGNSGNFAVDVSDKEDGTLKDGSISAEKVRVTFDFLAQGYDMTNIAQGHQRSELPGKSLIAASDCKTCHTIEDKSAGPSYKSVALRYEKDTKALEALSDKVIKGGSGVWGDTPMAAHPQLTKEQAFQMVEYILSLSKEEKIKRYPVKGTVKFDQPEATPDPKGAYILTAIYEDKGNGIVPSLAGEKSVVLRAPSLNGSDIATLKGARTRKYPTGSEVIEGIKNGGSVTTKPIDLTGVGKIEFALSVNEGSNKGGEIDVFLDAVDGKKIGTVRFDKSVKVPLRAGWHSTSETIRIGNAEGLHALVFVFRNADAGEADLFTLRAFNLRK